MIERVTELQGRVQSARAALEALAERAARLRARLETAPAAVAPTARPVEPAGTSFVPIEAAAALPPGETSALASSLERLSKQTAWVAVGGANEGDDGRFVSDAWEIALISEEGK
jgi:hypothetical protein